MKFANPHADRGNDLYCTPPVAVEALLRVEDLPTYLWEPAAGRGHIVKVLREAGHRVVASDLLHYDFELDFEADFLAQTKAPRGCEGICTNPPYRLANQFARHALDLAPRVYLLVRLSFLESTGRTEILEERGLARVYVFRNRLPMIHRDGYGGPRIDRSSVAYAWLCWDRGHTGDTTFHRISWTAGEVEPCV